MRINEMVEQVHQTAREKGWWNACAKRFLHATKVPYELVEEDVKKLVPEKLCLIHSEISEALEDYRNDEMAIVYENAKGVRVKAPLGEAHDLGYKPCGFPSELADAVIRIADLAGALGIDLEAAIVQKMSYNRQRPFRHGGKKA